MKIRTLVSMGLEGKAIVLARMQPSMSAFYRLCFLAGALRHGVLDQLARGPRSFEALADTLGATPASEDALRSWLAVGEKLGELKRDGQGYSLRGFLARKLARKRHDASAALLEEVVLLHSRLLFELPGRLAEGQPFSLADQEGEMIARSSRILEPVVVETIQRAIPQRGPIRLLEVGCGSGVYLRHAAEWNPELRGAGFELQAEVAELARSNLKRWGLSHRFQVEAGDIRDQEPSAEAGERFDVLTLHNNIYYFLVDERVSLLEHLRGFLKPGGKLLITTGAQGGNAGMEVLSLWGAATQGCGRLPEPSEMADQLRQAGFEPEKPYNHLPGDAFYSFIGVVPA